MLIASPGDVVGARDEVERELHLWNSARSAATRVTLQPRRWETDGIPLLGRGDAQSVLNTQVVDAADIVIAVFHTRLGTRTPRAVSGTAEELERTSAAGKPVHVWFYEQSVPFDVDEDQLRALRAFRMNMESDNFVGTFNSYEDLRTKVRRAVEHDVANLMIDALPDQGIQAQSSIVLASDRPEVIKAFARMKRVLGRLSFIQGSLMVDGKPVGDRIIDYYNHYIAIAEHLSERPEDIDGAFETIWEHGAGNRTFISETQAFEASWLDSFVDMRQPLGRHRLAKQLWVSSVRSS